MATTNIATLVTAKISQRRLPGEPAGIGELPVVS
jgi:hypothetical protein